MRVFTEAPEVDDKNMSSVVMLHGNSKLFVLGPFPFVGAMPERNCNLQPATCTPTCFDGLATSL